MSTHSPGPWRFDEKECDIYRESDSTTIAVFSAEALPYLPRAADARLMAAAPELLEALELMLSQYGCSCGTSGCNKCTDIDIAREAIRKARGE